MSNIPIILCNRNRLTTTRNLVNQLVERGYKNLYIIDAVSTYEPLLEWYKEQKDAEIIYMKQNIGHKVLWNSDILQRFKEYPFIVYSDSDISLNPNTPPNFIETMIKVCKDYKMDKVGLAINISNLPNYPESSRAGAFEQQWWQTKIPSMEHELYLSDVDTTFCLLRNGKPFTYRALRIAGDFTCDHMPWYNDPKNLSDEEKYYIEHAELKVSEYKQRLMGLR